MHHVPERLGHTTGDASGMNKPIVAEAAGRSREGTRKPAKRPLPKVDFLHPAGAPALYSPDSIAWQVFKNPVALFVGGVAAVLLELAEERVRSGVWEHSIFPTDPITRMRRTGLVAQVSVYAPRATAERLIASVVQMHARVEGRTPRGTPYRASDPELLNWVQCTADYGFLEAYAAYCRPLTDPQRDRFYAESLAAAALFLADGAPRSLAEQRQQFEAMRPHLEAHPIVFEFLGIMKRTPTVSLLLQPVQWMMVRAGIDLLPAWIIQRLTLDTPQWQLRSWERRLLMGMGALFERLPIPNVPAVLASRRMGLPGNFLYKKPASGP
jgi:uncharacterized protein (DUF2236 family)